MPLVVHGVVRAGTFTGEALAEAAGAPVDVVSYGHVAGLVSATDGEEVLPSRANLLRHTRVLEEAVEVTTVIPMRFGVAVPDGETLMTEYLRVEEEALLATLERLDGHVELRLKGRYSEEAAIRSVLASDRRARRLHGRPEVESRVELGERVVEGIRALKERHLEQVADALQPSAAAMAAGEVAEPLEAFRLSLLVARDAIHEVEHRRDELAATMEPSPRMELLGPIPPFSFTGSGGG